MGTFLVRIARLACAGLGIAAIVSAVTATTGSLGNFFSYFTIESNMLAIVVLIVGGLLGPRSRDWAYLRGAAILFMVITGIVYAALLANAEVGLTTAWVDDTLHRVIPLVMLADWIFFPPWTHGSFRALYAVVLAVSMGLLAIGVNAIGRRRGGALGRPRVTSLS